MIISDFHIKFSHAGCYSLLAELRKEFYVPCYFSVVKKVLKACILCRRFNARSIKLNSSPYRDFRIEPPQVPFRYIFVNYFGPFCVTYNKQKVKCWVLCITCLWTRAVNLKVCINLSVEDFLKCLQLHFFEFGTPELFLSDLGSQLVAGTNFIKDLLKDPETKLFLERKGIKTP